LKSVGWEASSCSSSGTTQYWIVSTPKKQCEPEGQ
jgi:uncharacterized protein YqkB